MKKICYFILMLLSVFVLVSCDDTATKTVKFYVDNELYETVKVESGESVNAVTEPKKTGYTFQYWKDADGKVNFPLIVEKNIRLDANFLKNVVKETFTIQYFVDNELYEEFKITEGETFEAIENPAKEGYNFQYWVDSVGKVTFPLYAVDNIRLDAKFLEENETVKTDKLDIYYLNDTHGAILNNNEEMGMAKIANLINTKYAKKPHETVFIAGGDMFQGQLISNDNKGALMIEILNAMNLDAFVLGNHEFDWGLETILEYFNPETSGVKANFKALGANVKLKSTNERPNFLDAYTIIDKGDKKIGIVGVMGDGLERSISGLRIADYYFSDAYSAVLEAVNEIKNQVDTIVVVLHNNGGTNEASFNGKVANLEKVSSVFNAHSHTVYEGSIMGVPYLQAGSNGKYVGNIKMDLNSSGGKVIPTNTTVNIYDEYSEELLQKPNKQIETVINKYYEQVKNLYEEVLLVAENNMYQYPDLSIYIAKLMALATGSTAGFQNSGGTRASLQKGQSITAADLFKIFPFDNKVVVFEVDYNGYQSIVGSMEFYYIDASYSPVKGKYLIATNDYIFFSYYQFAAYRNGEYREVGDMYQMLYENALKLRNAGHTKFSTDSPILIDYKNKAKVLENRTFFFFLC